MPRTRFQAVLGSDLRRSESVRQDGSHGDVLDLLGESDVRAVTELDLVETLYRDSTRARLSTDGSLYTCLFATRGHDLRALVRAGASDEEIASAIATVWAARTDRYSELRSSETAGLPKIEMSYIGG